MEGREGTAADGATEAVAEYQEAIDQLVDTRHSRPVVPSVSAKPPASVIDLGI